VGGKYMDFLRAFIVGGLICVIGQLLIDYTKLTPARILVSFVVIGVILGGIGLYQPLVEFAGAGATVPLTGFGNTLVQGTKEAIQEKGALGILTGPLSCASVGITAAMICGLVVAFVTKPKSK
jgi:stage V sporulation protein AE